MKLNKGYINVRSRPHQKQDYIWLTIWAKIFSTGKLLPSYNHKVCMINHMHVDRENVIIAHNHAPLGLFAWVKATATTHMQRYKHMYTELMMMHGQD